MDISIVLLLIALWTIVCPILVYGLTLAYFQDKWPGLSEARIAEDRGHALGQAGLVVILGPVGVIMAFVQCDFGRYGLRFRMARSLTRATHPPGKC